MTLRGITEGVVITAALSVCLTTWWPIVSTRDAAMLVTPLYTYTVLGSLVLGLLLAQRDGWLGAIVAFLSVRALILPQPQALSVVVWLTFGAGLVWLISGLEPVRVRWARRGLITLGIAQALYALPQLVHMDPLWVGLAWTQRAQMHGTFENSRQLAGALAMIAPLAPVAVLPVLAGTVILSGSILGAVALGVGLTCRHRAQWRLILPLSAGALGAAVVFRGVSGDSTWMRLTVWRIAAGRWTSSIWSVLIGFGPSSWFASIPDLQAAAVVGSIPDAFFVGHSDPGQYLYEYGLVGLVPVLGWLWVHRHALLRAEAAGSVAALGVYALGMSPFHFPTTGTLGAVVLGLAAHEGTT